MKRAPFFVILRVMKFISQISAYSMLLIMLFGMMHNAFPHVHHQYGTVIAEGEFHHHNHPGDHHHHPEKDDKDQEQKNFLDFFLENHSHSTHTHRYTPAAVEQVKLTKQVDIKAFCRFDILVPELRQTSSGLHRYVLFRDFVPDNPYLIIHPHRGPPSLG